MTQETWAVLVPELMCSDLAASLGFYRDVLGFTVRFERPEDRFAYLDLNGAQVMLEEVSPESWSVGPLVRPFGRGLNLQIEVPALAPLLGRLAERGLPVFRSPEESWYRDGAREHGQIEFLVQDPDGYLLRFVEILGDRPLAAGPEGGG